MRKVLLPLLVLGVAGFSSQGLGQTLKHTLDKVELSRAPIEVALKQIFADKASFIVSPEVQGTVTASFHSITADKALAAVLKIAKATSRFEDGIYYIEPAIEVELPLNTPLNLSFEGTDARDAIKKVMKASRGSYTIAPDVQGTITASLHNVGFPEALDRILEQVGATYSMDGGVINIRSKDKSSDPFIGNNTQVSLDVSAADLRSAFRLMFLGKPISYTIDSEVQGTVTAKFNSIRLEDALEKLLKQVNATYRNDGGVYQIIPISR